MLLLQSPHNRLRSIQLHPLASQLTVQYLGIRWAADLADAQRHLAAELAEKHACQQLLVCLGVQQKRLQRLLSPSYYRELLLLLRHTRGLVGTAALTAAAAVPQGLQVGEQLCQQWLQWGLSALLSPVVRLAGYYEAKRRRADIVAWLQRESNRTFHHADSVRRADRVYRAAV